MAYDKWRSRLKGEAVENFLRPDAEDEGYYRKPYGVKQGNGRMRIDGYTPVALFVDGGAIQGLWGIGADMRDMTDEELDDESLWSYLVQNPVPYEVYKAVAEDGQPWPEVKAEAAAQAAVQDAIEGQRLAENQEAAGDAKPKAPETVEEHKAAIEVLVATAKDVTMIDTNEDASVALGTVNLLAERRLAADKAGKALYKPPFEQYKKLFAAWTPMVKLAEDAEKRVTRLILTFRESERGKAAAAAAAETARAAQETEANERAADRAIANGEEPPTPEVEEPPQQQAPPEIKPTHGTRKLREEEQTFVEIVDEAQVATYFRGNDELRAVLHTLALRATKRGETVPGTTSRKGLV